jgi:hypothetical protein
LLRFSLLVACLLACVAHAWLPHLSLIAAVSVVGLVEQIRCSFSVGIFISSCWKD